VVALWKTPRAVATHPWFIATLFDTYFAFLTFYAWVAYKETGNVARALWLIAILLLGNITMAIYMLRQLFRLPTDATMEQLLLRKK
jgi:predicted permease